MRWWWFLERSRDHVLGFFFLRSVFRPGRKGKKKKKGGGVVVGDGVVHRNGVVVTCLGAK